MTGGRGATPIIAPVVFTALVTGLGNLINDCFDVETDRVNKPRRPIPSGRLSAGFASRFYWIASAIVTVTMFFVLPVAVLVIVVLWELLLYFYASKAKRMTLVGNVIVGAIAASSFLTGAVVTGDYAAIWVPVVFTFLFVLGREQVKGAEDIEGDKGIGALTLAVRVGAGRTLALGTWLLFVVALGAPLPGLVAYYSRAYTLIMELTVVPGILVAVYLVLRSHEREVLHQASWILKFQMFFGIVAMALGRI